MLFNCPLHFSDMVSINPGVALGGAILGITPGAALEKKSVRDIAANFAANKLGKQERQL